MQAAIKSTHLPRNKTSKKMRKQLKNVLFDQTGDGKEQDVKTRGMSSKSSGYGR